MQSWADWLDLRLDYRRFAIRLRNRILPDGPSWIYTSASCLLWLLVIQCVTGLLLMATYCPSMASAWASVHFIDQTTAGRFLRGIHHYSSHAMIILFAVHVIRVLLTGAYRAPRELVWITGLMLFPLVIVWTVTGNPLSASQKGVSQIQVEGNILGSTPLIGAFLQRLLFGGDDVGNLTLTRLYFLHVGLIPVLVAGLCFVHLHQVMKHSQYLASTGSTGLTYWPYQTVRNMVTLAAVIAILSLFAWNGAPLAAPADPDVAYSPRPEWYFRWLFELRRHFTGDTEFIATMVIPSAFLGAFMSAPFLDRFSSRRVATACRIMIVVGCVGGWSWLTFLSYLQDWQDPGYLAEQVEFDRLSSRALELAQTVPISEKGAVQLLRQDPQTQGPRIFSRHCVSCHSYVDAQGRGLVAAEPSAPNLYGVGTKEWIAGFLDPQKIASGDYFGRTKFADGDMVRHVQGLFTGVSEEGASAKREMQRAIVAALAAESGAEPFDSTLATTGRQALTTDGGCIDCHRFRDQGDMGTAPDLTGYASAEWLRKMIAKPTDKQFYSDGNDRMPEFAADMVHPELNLLSPLELDMLIRWLRNSLPNETMAH